MPTIPPEWHTSLPSGARFHCLLPGIQESFARDVNTSQIRIECVFNDLGNLKIDFFGSATYGGGGQEFIRRRLPLPNFYYPGSHYIDRFDLESYQPERPTGAYVSSNDANGWPVIDGYAQVRLGFTNRDYAIISDTDVNAAVAAARADPANGGADCVTHEMMRFVRFSRRYLPESRKIPSAGFEVYDDGVGAPHPVFSPFVIQEVGSLPTFQIEIVAECVFWPAKNFPDGGVSLCIGKVNGSTMLLNGTRYPKGTLLYKGPGADLTPYKWVDGEFYYDIPHLFGYRPDGWNSHRLAAPIAADNNRQWYPIRVKGTTSTPQFQYESLIKVFKPEPAH